MNKTVFYIQQLGLILAKHRVNPRPTGRGAVTAAKDRLVWNMFDIEPFNAHSNSGGYPILTMKMTGKNVVALAKKYARQQARDIKNV